MPAFDSSNIDPFVDYLPDGAHEVDSVDQADRQIAWVLDHARRHLEWLAHGCGAHAPHADLAHAGRVKALAERLDAAVLHWRLGPGASHLLLVADCVALRRLATRIDQVERSIDPVLVSAALRSARRSIESAELVIDALASAGWRGVTL